MCSQKFVTHDVQASKVFRNSTRKVANAVRQAARLLGKHSIPFWSVHDLHDIAALTNCSGHLDIKAICVWISRCLLYLATL